MSLNHFKQSEHKHVQICTNYTSFKTDGAYNRDHEQDSSKLFHSTTVLSMSKGYRLDLYEAGIQFPLSVFTFFTPPSLLSITNLLRFLSLKHRHIWYINQILHTHNRADGQTLKTSSWMWNVCYTMLNAKWLLESRMWANCSRYRSENKMLLTMFNAEQTWGGDCGTFTDQPDVLTKGLSPSLQTDSVNPYKQTQSILTDSVHPYKQTRNHLTTPQPFLLLFPTPQNATAHSWWSKLQWCDKSIDSHSPPPPPIST